jgi:hypothetical protein
MSNKMKYNQLARVAAVVYVLYLKNQKVSNCAIDFIQARAHVGVWEQSC